MNQQFPTNELNIFYHKHVLRFFENCATCANKGRNWKLKFQVQLSSFRWNDGKFYLFHRVMTTFLIISLFSFPQWKEVYHLNQQRNWCVVYLRKFQIKSKTDWYINFIKSRQRFFVVFRVLGLATFHLDKATFHVDISTQNFKL